MGSVNDLLGEFLALFYWCLGDKVTYTKQEFAAIVGAPICFLVLVIIGICCAFLVHGWWNRRHQGYNHLHGANNMGGGGGGNN